MIKESPFLKVNQIGIIVHDLDKTVKYYESLGIGPFKPMTGMVSKDRKIMGKPVPTDSIGMRISVARVGAVDLEMIQPTKGESVHMKSLRNKGEGINHLGFYVDDLEGEEAKLVKAGFNVIYSLRFEGGGGASYFNTDSIGGVLFELIQWPSGMSSKQEKTTENSEFKNSVLSRIHHVGVIAKDIDKVVGYYESLGIGPFESIVSEGKERKLPSGEPVEGLKLKVKHGTIGAIKMEVIEPVAGKWSRPWGDFLESRGEGISHIGFIADDIGKGEAALASRGLDIMYMSRYQHGGATTFFESEEIGGVLFELTQYPKSHG